MSHLQRVRDVIGFALGVEEFAALSLVLANKADSSSLAPSAE